MRYWILVILLNALFALVMYFAAPEMLGSPAYYAGATICAVVAFIITWRDPPGQLDHVIFFLVKCGVLAAGLALFVWGAGYRLAFWGAHNSDELVSSAFGTMLPDLAILTGILIVSGFLLLIRKR
ncbi:hypothetical protein [Lelliottia sp. WAP21]|uniref:hypothetical protein n=1 Tax=Lelliottia sp. WAP21 TaxID=2877426 RepID=UPI001E44AAE2|nr:hypothetical protein [Lelliottia sp. WAP21]